MNQGFGNQQFSNSAPSGQGQQGNPFGGFLDPLRRATPFLPWGRKPQMQAPSTPQFDYSPYAQRGASQAMVDPGAYDSFMHGLPPEIANALTLEQQQLERMNQLRQQWFNQWRQLANQSFGQSANALRSSMGLYA